MFSHFYAFYHLRNFFPVKLAALLVSFFIFFNSLSLNSAMLRVKTDISVHKNIFSTVLFVSDTIGNVSAALTLKITSSKDAAAKKEHNEKNDKKPAADASDFALVFNSVNYKIQNIQWNKAVFGAGGLREIIYEPYFFKQYLDLKFCYFSNILISYIALKKAHDDFYAVNNRNLNRLS